MSTLLAKIPNAHTRVCIAHGFERLELSGPFWHAFAAFKTCSHAFLLDSSVASSECGRYSFMGKQPIAVFQARRLNPQSRPFDAVMEVHRFESVGGKKYGDPPQRERISGDALETLRNLLAEYAAPFGAEERSAFLAMRRAVGMARMDRLRRSPSQAFLISTLPFMREYFATTTTPGKPIFPLSAGAAPTKRPARRASRLWGQFEKA
jgi:hypothetical protein